MSDFLRSKTVHKSTPRQVLYATDGMGRDTYIHYNNGGFWKDNVRTVHVEEKYEVPKHFNYKSLRYFNFIYNSERM